MFVANGIHHLGLARLARAYRQFYNIKGVIFVMRRGISSVVATVLIVVIVVIGAAIFLSVYLRSVRDITNRDLPLCAGIDLKLTKCIIFPAGGHIPVNTATGYYILPSHSIYFLVERLPGGEVIRDLRFKIIDTDGKSHSERPVNVTIPGYHIFTEYWLLAEYSTIEAVTFVDLANYSPAIPDYATVSAVVGNSETVCAPTNEPIKCYLYTPPTPPPIP